MGYISLSYNSNVNVQLMIQFETKQATTIMWQEKEIRSVKERCDKGQINTFLTIKHMQKKKKIFKSSFHRDRKKNFFDVR